MSGSSGPKLLRFKQAAQKATYQTRPGPALISIPEHQEANHEVEQPTKKELEKNKSLKSKIFAFCRKVYRRWGFKHLFPISVTIAYAFFGGWLFSKLEYENEIETKALKNEELEIGAQNLSLEIMSICQNSFSMPDNHTLDSIKEKVTNYQMNAGLVPADSINWDFWGGMFFAGTVFTTIGYGHYCPVTRNGKIAVMLYALIGIPMVLAMLNDYGKLLMKGLNKLWSLIRNAITKCIKILSHKEYSISAESADSFDFPIPIAIIFIVGWIFICAALFCIWEKRWSYFDSFYFFFISLSTVGK